MTEHEEPDDPDFDTIPGLALGCLLSTVFYLSFLLFVTLLARGYNGW
jgi:hypothetical protein